MRKRFIAVGVAIATLATLAIGAPAQGTTGGEADGNLHPDVGLILYYSADGRFRCSATLVSPTIVVTAGHCTLGTVGKTLVTFSSVIAENPPSGFPVAADPVAGYTQAEIEGAGFISGTAYTHPQYSDFTDLDNWNDVGVIVLDTPLASHGDGYPPIAPVGTLDAIAKSDLSKTLFTAVGYGTEVRKPLDGPQKPQPMTYPLLRRYVDMPGQKLTPQILQANGNPNDTHGTGGTCFGDSGGPVFLDGELVAVTSYGYTANCRYLGGYQRLDIPSVANWLATFEI
jgi:hypothetical protein